ncbi:peptidoglycan-binding domain-containing protein [Nereida sp. MMG025]|uniref:peptidoglycan-binding domain-containing protein n=1 Tax=Nereida sp. MMG025 TaxID=2909981 RepID=UPI001F1C07B8|nr:peptidoglycan-binding domain-containing protein [Nereida sp. MMG025]MCF6443812.1 peptidoglycan-binding protein [Nereida sp. MMG025]
MTVFIAVCAALAGCVPATEPEVTRQVGIGPPVAQDGSCWGRDVSPATIETVTNQVLVQPAQVDVAGNVRSPAVYRTETLQRIVDERKELWFETPCAKDLTPQFVASLQRALKARGHYSGPITSQMDGRTRAAIRAYQRPEGLDSGILSLAAAQRLGLVRAPKPS